MIGRFLGDAFGSLTVPTNEMSTVLLCGARLLIYTLKKTNRPCSQWRPFLPRGMFECDIACCWSEVLLYMLFMIRCNPMHPLYGALPVPYAEVLVTRGTYGILMYNQRQSRATFEIPSRGLNVTINSIIYQRWFLKLLECRGFSELLQL